jgi:hypothetical protein
VLARRHSLSRYILPSVDLFSHFRIARGDVQPGFERLSCLLARVWADGTFELVSPGWDGLGYSNQQLVGRSLCELIALEPDAACAVVEALLTEGRSMQFPLRRRNGGELKLHWNRQFDDFTTSLFIVAQEMPAVFPAGPKLVSAGARSRVANPPGAAATEIGTHPV